MTAVAVALSIFAAVLSLLAWLKVCLLEEQHREDFLRRMAVRPLRPVDTHTTRGEGDPWL